MSGNDSYIGQSELPDRDTWITPRGIAERMGEWDLDPCSNDRSHVKARRTFNLNDRGEDGLVLARYVSRNARVFINPPYSRGNVPQWVDAYQHTRFCFLLRLDPSTDWFERLMWRTSTILLLRERVNFEPPPGVDPHHLGGNPFPHALFYRFAEDVTPEIESVSYVFHFNATHSAKGIL